MPPQRTATMLIILIVLVGVLILVTAGLVPTACYVLGLALEFLRQR